MVFKFSKNQTVEKIRIVFIIPFGLERTSELFCWTRFYLSFKEISEFAMDLRLTTWTRLCLNVFGSIGF